MKLPASAAPRFGRVACALLSCSVTLACAAPSPRVDPAVATSARCEPLSSPAIHWYRDDPEAAFARARSERKLVVVDLWAPWCHTCLSMQKFVLTDSKLPAAGGRFVFLAVDTELAKNAEFLQRFPSSGWPTFYVLAPDGPSVRGRWLGAASPSQFARFLADAERAASALQAPRDDASTLLTLGDVLAGQKRYAEAAAKYAEALARAPSTWPRAPDVRVARASALMRAGDVGACVDMAFEPSFAATTPAISASDHAAYVLDCAERLPASDERQRAARERVAAKLAALCERGDAELTPDDRGDACGNLVSAREALGDAAGAQSAAETRLAVLEAAARDLPDDVALIYDPARTDTLVRLGRGEEALRLLQAREAALPASYSPPYYTARVAKQLRRWDFGLAAIERAFKLAYGPRRANLYGLKIDLLLGAGRNAQAVTVLQAELAELAALPPGQERPEALAAATKRLRDLQARP